MKRSTRPISSPGRTEKFPPPLMRFLRSNVGSKSSSRGRRSRASPMFIKKKNTVIETTQEPSSPKVTCIGQVRVRRSKKNKTTTTTSITRTTIRHPSNRLCGCLRKLKPKWCRSVLRKWVSFFRCGYCKNSRDLHDSPPVTPRSLYQNAAGDNGEEDEHVTVEADNRGLISRPPPRNAFLLTRCRSAPYRSSSLASKFWESTMEKTEEEEVAEKIKKLSIKEEEEAAEEEIANDNGVNESKCNECNGVEELKNIKVTPLILTRCKSEPARTWDQIIV
ncbi:uncharacterized protein LOC112521016 [Cynara cardunculus var. scolymus]|uniref:Uncharacterized protein n=1 Tax=Cynara cardunculus var. scolymus TaxID=59895 RepID=A0A118JTT9_CYNCS|nr:uncharacterized protein LOC112521016 [Cynara cardunculus var. scolymus]KVH90457.1 hypothetical protein Ccrd_007492 [Cynara cardunculus var. scolymus]